MKVIIDRFYEVGKAKIKDNTFLSVDYRYTEVQKNKDTGEEFNRFVNNMSAECTQFMHPSLIEAFRKLIPHLGFLTEYAFPRQGDEKAFENNTLLEDNRFRGLRVNGVTWKGGADASAIVIMGSRTLANGKVIAINTPLTHFDYAEDNPEVYEFIDNLLECCNTLRQEVQKYVKGEKFGKNPQLDVFSAEEQQEEKQEKEEEHFEKAS